MIHQSLCEDKMVSHYHPWDAPQQLPECSEQHFDHDSTVSNSFYNTGDHDKESQVTLSMMVLLLMLLITCELFSFFFFSLFSFVILLLSKKLNNVDDDHQKQQQEVELVLEELKQHTKRRKLRRRKRTRRKRRKMTRNRMKHLLQSKVSLNQRQGRSQANVKQRKRKKNPQKRERKQNLMHLLLPKHQCAFVQEGNLDEKQTHITASVPPPQQLNTK